MLRALLISIAFHLMILLSPIIPDGAMGKSSLINGHLVGVSFARHSESAGAVVDPEIAKGRQGMPYFRREEDRGLRSKQPRSEGSSRAILQSAESPRALAPDDHFASSDISADTQNVPSEGEQEYRLNVSREARKFKRYPLIARDHGREGVVVVAVSMALAAARPVVSLERSSGHDELDRQALEMMAAAVNQATVPEGLRGRRFGISLPIEYRLTEK